MYYDSAEYLEKVSNAIKNLKVHDHTCSIYDNKDEQFAVIIPFFKYGLENNEKCIYVADENSVEEVTRFLGREIPYVNKYIEKGQLIIINKRQAYFEHGYFDPELMIDAIRAHVNLAKEEGYSFLRITGEMTWALENDPGVDRLMEYEAEVNHIYEELDAVAVCQYNKSRFSPEVIRHILLTHPVVIYKGTVCKNYTYVPPEIYLKPDDQYADVNRTLDQILEIEKRELSLIEKNAELQEINDKLSAEVLIRKQTEDVLLKTLRDLERSNKELEQFAYVASHDLQEPIRMVSTYSKLLEKQFKDNLDDKSSQYMYYLSDGAKRMYTLINDLLTFSRLSSKNDQFVPIDLNSVVVEIMRDLQVAIADHNAEVEFEHLPTINADPTQMKQLFQNLIQNAIKFKGKETPLILITSERIGDEWFFTVKDNGIGIAKEFHEKIFVIFQRLHEQGKYPGTGIGLSICKKIVERHGGRIWVESEKDKGAKFCFTIS